MNKETTGERISNYDVMRDRMELEFSKYNHDAIIQKFHLSHDADYIYLRFAGRDYRIRRTSGRVEWILGDEYFHADYNAAMTIFDILAWSRPDCKLDGHFVSAGEFKGMVQSASPAAGIFEKESSFFAGRGKDLEKACAMLGGKPDKVGDVSSLIPLFDFFPVLLQFWDADEEFGAVLKFMWDKNATDYMHYETIAFAAFHLIDRLKECMGTV